MIELTKNKSFCVLPFIHFSVFGNKIKPCCRFNPGTEFVAGMKKYLNGKYSINDIFYCSEYSELRKKMLSGELIDGCYKCYIEEKIGSESMRLSTYQDYCHYLNRDFKPTIKFLEIGFSNYCNSRCRTCSSELSTSWFIDDKALGSKYKRRLTPRKRLSNLIKINNRDLAGLEYLKLVGGEPMLNPEFVPFLQQLIKRDVNKNCWLDLFTNVTYFPNPESIQNILSFQGLRIHLSIDGHKDKNNYIRYPGKWSQVDKVVTQWLILGRDNPHIEIQIEITISIYNVMYLGELLGWWIKKNKSIGNKDGQVHFLYVFYPTYLSVINLPEEIKVKIRGTLKIIKDKYRNYAKVTYNVDNLKSLLFSQGKNQLREFSHFTKDLDKLRQESFKNTFPELNSLIKKYL